MNLTKKKKKNQLHVTLCKFMPGQNYWVQENALMDTTWYRSPDWSNVCQLLLVTETTVSTEFPTNDLCFWG
jgi:hypothetical protein